jgi:hypothetical protein
MTLAVIGLAIAIVIVGAISGKLRRGPPDDFAEQPAKPTEIISARRIVLRDLSLGPVLEIYGELTGAVVDAGQSVRELPRTISYTNVTDLTREEVVRQLEQALRDQAGIDASHLGPKLIKLVQIGPAKPPAPSPVSDALLSEPPKLQFLAWRDEWQTNQPGAAQHADGAPVLDATELGWLKQISHVGGGTASDSPTLYLWFSQSLFDNASYADVSLSDPSGKLLPFHGGGIAVGRHLKVGNCGWITYSINRGAGLGFPPVLNLKLRYTVGPWEREETVSSDALLQNGALVLQQGVEVRSIGQQAGGGSFVALAYGLERSGTRQLGVTAIGKDGRVLGLAGGSLGGQYDEQSQKLVERFCFQAPLSEIASFRIGTRPVRTMEWVNVVLPHK